MFKDFSKAFGKADWAVIGNVREIALLGNRDNLSTRPRGRDLLEAPTLHEK